MSSIIYTINGNAVTRGGYVLCEAAGGSLTITKVIDGTDFDLTRTFSITATFSTPVTYNNVTALSHTVSLAHNQSATITGIPHGTTYQVAESLTPADIAAGYSLSGIVGSPGTMEEGSSFTATAHNNYSMDLAPKTIRFRFGNSSYDPSQSFIPDNRQSPHSFGTWTRVSTEPNIWDYYRDDTDWTVELASTGTGVTPQTGFSGSDTGDMVVLGANLAGITTVEGVLMNAKTMTEIRALSNTSSLVNTTTMFSGCNALISVPLFDTSHVTDIQSMFRGCVALTSVPLFNTSSAIYMGQMFSGCVALTSVPLFDTSHVTDAFGMFYRCYALESVPLFDLSSATNLSYMFEECVSLESAPAFNTSSAVYMNDMFCYCTALKSVPLLNTASATGVSAMFNACWSAESGAYALYQQMSGQATPPARHTACFKDCGRDTTTGAAELARIPSDWK